MSYFETNISIRFSTVSVPNESTGNKHKTDFKSPPATISPSCQLSHSDVPTLMYCSDSDTMMTKKKTDDCVPSAFPIHRLDESTEEYLNYSEYMLHNDTPMYEMVENDLFDQRERYNNTCHSNTGNLIHPTSLGDDEVCLVPTEISDITLPATHLLECEHFGIELASVYRDHDFSFYPSLDDKEVEIDMESDSNETSTSTKYGEECMDTDYDADTEDMEGDSDETCSCTSKEDMYDADTEEGVDTEED